MAWHGKSLGALLAALHQEFGEHHYGRVDLDVTAQQKAEAMEWFSDGDAGKILEWPVVGRETMDGIKLYLGEIGWVMVRASGTENLLRVYAETSEKAWTRRVLQAVTDKIQKT
jgi:phosphomannomutase